MVTNVNHAERQAEEGLPLNGIGAGNGLREPASEQRTPSPNEGPRRNEQNVGRRGLKHNERIIYRAVIAILFVLLMISFGFNIYFSLGKSSGTTEEKKPSVKIDQLDATSIPTTSCFQDWTRNAESCYLFSDTENTWNYSYINCSSYGASLLVVDTHKEMDFINQNKALSEYWLGLQRKSIEEVWTLPNGTYFKLWFEIKGEGLCASLNADVVSSTDCDNHRRWICRKNLHAV